MTAFFHPHNLFETLIIYAAIAVLAAIVCGAIALVEERRKRRAMKLKNDQDNNLNLKISEK